MIKRLNDLIDKVEQLIDYPANDTYSLGFTELDQYYKIALGATTYIAGIPAHGKCLGKGTKIIMADATLKCVEDIVIGDKLMGINGQIKTVLRLGSGNEMMYKISQMKGIDYIVNESHILSLKRSKTSKKRLRGEVLNISVKDYLKMGPEYAKVYKGYKEASQFYEQNLNLDPYFLGCWLGDGRSNGCDITTQDNEIIEYLKSYAILRKTTISEYKYGAACSSYAILGTQTILRSLNLIKNKHIPNVYLNNSTENRLKLLAGIIDTDGYLDAAQSIFEVTQKNKRLANDIKFLADTLGFRTSIAKKNATLNRPGKSQYVCEVYRITIGGDISLIPTKIKRKQAPYKKTRNTRYTGITVTPIGYGEYFGFTLDGDGLFLLEDGTVTHNTEWLFEILIRLSEIHGFRHFLYSPETGNAEEVYLELACKYLKKVSRENAFHRIRKDDFRHAIGFIHDHFIVRDIEEKAPSPMEIIEQMKEVISENKIHTMTLDPWNELSHNFTEHGGRQDTYLEVVLGNIRRFSRKENIHTFIIAHPRTLIKNKEGRYDPPTAFEFSGGATWYAKADSILCVNRPLEFSEALFERSYVDIIVQKAKPKKVGKKGIFEIDYDYNTGRYKLRHDAEVTFNTPSF